jgi:jouberin
VSLINHLALIFLQFFGSTFSFQWEELIAINDDINHVNRLNVAVFFELFNDGMASECRSCWAFLVLSPGKEVTNVDRRSELQLYRYQKVSKRAQKNGLPEVYNQWAMKRVEYVGPARKATLKVTVKGLRAATDDEHLASQDHNQVTEKRQWAKDKLGHYNLDSMKFNHDFGKLPGQSCRAPNKTIHRVPVAGKGCLAAKLSECGELLAYTEITEAQSYIHILQIPEFQEVTQLLGHQQLIHDLNWGQNSESGSTKYLISASSDCTAMVWFINRKEKTHKSVILPHPAFVYSGLILAINQRHLVVATGGRDQKVGLKTVSSNFECFTRIV